MPTKKNDENVFHIIAEILLALETYRTVKILHGTLSAVMMLYRVIDRWLILRKALTSFGIRIMSFPKRFSRRDQN